jgi:ATP-dependent Clp protease ATP-binding subunit ClpB
MLSPCWPREIDCIGATTLNESARTSKKTALERRFQPFSSKSLAGRQHSILRGLKERFETHHGVKITTKRLSPPSL